MKETIDRLHKKCELKELEEIENKGKILIEKYEKILKTIEKDLEKETKEYKEKIKLTNNYDKRLVEYTFNKKNNYITLAIDHLSKDNIKLNNDTIEIEQNLNHNLLIYALVALYKINNRESKITIIEPVEEQKQKIKKK